MHIKYIQLIYKKINSCDFNQIKKYSDKEQKINDG